ncbi:hypothetical protein HK104_004485, partial [Borealophlyctis nickersoniae]
MSTYPVSSTVPASSTTGNLHPSTNEPGEYVAPVDNHGVAASIANTVKSGAQMAAAAVQRAVNVPPTTFENRAAGAAEPTYGVNVPQPVPATISAVDTTPSTTYTSDSTPSLTSRAGSTAGAAAGTVAGTLSSAANMAKNAASSLLGSSTTSAPSAPATTTTTPPPTVREAPYGVNVPQPVGTGTIPGTPAPTSVDSTISPGSQSTGVYEVTDTTPSVSARAGSVAGSVAGTVGGTLSTAAALAKNAASNLLGSTGTTTESRSIEGQGEQPDVLTRAGSTAGTVAGTVAGTLATVAAGVKNAAVSAISAVAPSHPDEHDVDVMTPGVDVTTPGVSRDLIPEQKYDLSQAPVTAAYHDELNTRSPPSVLNPPASSGVAAPTTTETVKDTAAVAANTTAEKAGAAAGYVAGAATSAYNTAANAATVAKDTVVGATAPAYNAAANTATAAKDTVVGATSSTYNAAANTAASAKDTVLGATSSAYNSAADTAAQYTAGSRLKPTTETSYELTSSELGHPLTDVRPDAPAGMNGDEGVQRALPAPPASSFGTRVNEAPSYLGTPDLTVDTGDNGLITEEAIRAVATPSDRRSDDQQKLVDKLISGRDLTSVGQPNVEFGS